MMPTEKRPVSPGWARLSNHALPATEAESYSVWAHNHLVVVSQVLWLENPGGDGEGYQWALTVAATGRRPTDSEVALVLQAFDMNGAEEDNHYPAQSRDFYLVVDPLRREGCRCKADEEIIVTDGYRWSNPIDGPCRGCEWSESAGAPCPLHEKGQTNDQ